MFNLLNGFTSPLSAFSIVESCQPYHMKIAISDVSDGLNYLMSRGLAVVYELIGLDGKIAIEKTFDLAVYWKDNIQFDKMILDYDNYNPDNTLNAQIILVMPEVISPWTVTFNNNIETRYNNINQVTNELLEVLRTTASA